MQGPGETKEKSVFLREATGLRKDVSFLDSVSLNISWSTAGTAIGFIGFYLLAFPTMNGVNLVYGTIISFLLVIPQVVIYTIMQRRVSRTGGDYVWVSRQLGGFVGTVTGFSGAGVIQLSFIAVIILSTIFTIGSVGVSLGYPSFLGLALPGNIQGSDPLLQFIIGTVIFVALVGINILVPKYAYKLLTIFVLLAVTGLIVAWAVILGAGHSGVVNYMNSLGNTNLTYAKVASSYTGSSFNFANTILLLPFFFLFAFPWINMSTITGSELKKGAAVNWSVPLAAITTFLLFLGGIGIMYYVGGLQFVNAAMSNATLIYTYGFNFWTLAMGMANSPAVAWFLGIAWILWNVAIIITLIISFARYFLALSFDRSLPSAVGYVSPKYGSPVVAHLIDLFVSITLVGLAAFLYGTFSALSAADVTAMAFFACVGIAAFKYAIKQEKNLSTKAVLATAGLLNVPIFGFVIYEIVAYSGVWGGNILSYSYGVGAAVAAALIYSVSKHYHLKHDSIDISLAFKEIPPE